MFLKQNVEMVIDMCSGGSLDRDSMSAGPPDSHSCRTSTHLPESKSQVKLSAPLQLGGIAHPPPDHVTHGWSTPISSTSFKGCVANVRVNGEVSSLLQINICSYFTCVTLTLKRHIQHFYITLTFIDCTIYGVLTFFFGIIENELLILGCGV